MPAGWPSVVNAKTLAPSHSAAQRCNEGWSVLPAAITTIRFFAVGHLAQKRRDSACYRRTPLHSVGKTPRTPQFFADSGRRRRVHDHDDPSRARLLRA